MLDLDTGKIENLTNDAFADYGPTFSPGRLLPRLHGAHQRQREAVPPRPRHEEEDAAHLRHPRRCAGEVRGRPHAGVPVDGGEPDAADRAGGREERQHLQHLDARPEDRRAAPVHRRRRRQRPRRSCCRATTDQAHRLRDVFQGRVGRPHARPEGPAADGARQRLRRAGPGAARRLPGAAHAHAGAGEQARQGQVREDVPRRPAAGERRRHQRRRHLRRHGDHVQRRARRQGVQLLRRVDLAVPHDRRVVHEPLAPAPIRDSGLLADRLLLRAAAATSSTTRRCRGSSTATRRSRRARHRAAASTRSIRSTGTGASRCRRAS